ncbi:MAG TPA: PTS sugar transporter subunit IIA, partial [Phycisphaerae bacterium]|nr:PTS sugar transporter subunit IIA [Phycisphaerae bacterium]
PAPPPGRSGGGTHLAAPAGKPATPVDFQSLDRRPVTFVVLLVSPPDQTGPHIQALAKVSRLMNIEDFRNRVDLARTPEDLFDAIRTTEAGEHTPR